MIEEKLTTICFIFESLIISPWHNTGNKHLHYAINYNPTSYRKNSTNKNINFLVLKRNTAVIIQHYPLFLFVIPGHSKNPFIFCDNYENDSIVHLNDCFQSYS
jgi:hypothetical protein